MDKFKMAHEYLLKLIESQGLHIYQSDIERCFDIADMMQAEADKRSNSQPVITDQDKQHIEQAYSNIVKPSIDEEWQPDWSQSPNAYAWRMYGDGSCAWLIDVGNEDFKWFGHAPSFNYNGNWKDSLRKRPSNI